MDPRLDKLKESLQLAVEGMSGEQSSWHLPGKWCAGELLEHLYLTYTGTIKGFERVVSKGKPLASRASVAQRALTLVVVGSAPHACRGQSTCDRDAERLAGGTVRNEIGQRLRRWMRSSGSAKRAWGPGSAARPSDSGAIECDAVENASCGAWATSSETASPASRTHDAANGLKARARVSVRTASWARTLNPLIMFEI